MKLPIFSKGEKHKKSWGYELWIHNSPLYCGKILHFNKDSKFSLHLHLKKTETWYCMSGFFELIYIDTEIAEYFQRTIQPTDVIHLEPGVPHQLICLEAGDIFEVSTQHFPEDSYRIEPGDSQL